MWRPPCWRRSHNARTRPPCRGWPRPWFPDISVNVFTLVATLLLISINFMNVRNYGEFEFWFALIKATNDVAHVLPTDMVNRLPNGDPERFIELVERMR